MDEPLECTICTVPATHSPPDSIHGVCDDAITPLDSRQWYTAFTDLPWWIELGLVTGTHHFYCGGTHAHTSRAHGDAIFIVERGAWVLVLKIEHTFPQVHSSTIDNFTMQCYPRCQQDMNSPSLPGKLLLHRNGSQPSLTWWTLCYPCLIVNLQLKSFCNYFYSHFHSHTSYNSTGCAIYSTRERLWFHHSQNRKVHTLPLSSAIKKLRHKCSWHTCTHICTLALIHNALFIHSYMCIR